MSTSPMRLDPSRSGDDHNALYLARACELAYLPEARAEPLFRDELGLEATLISVDNTQAYVGSGASELVVTFRGSEAPTSLDGFKDWLLTNANNFLVLPEGRIGTDFAAAGVGARFHRGFMEALAEIWDPLLAAVEAEFKRSARPLWVTGHSLGGSLALLAAWRFQQNFLDVHQVVTFGAPMVGNKEAADAFRREFPGKIYRYIDDPDPVPLLPAISLIANLYNHCLDEVRLGGQASGATLSAMQQLGGKVAQAGLDATAIDEVWGFLLNRIAAHDITNYQKLIGERFGS
ncbi:lipase family protein [Tautonia marina]|uniref:lipase family protein n=1 Tax=Tautonia marina TaxID=2653855 RepID=UPI00191C39D5|nr:lipase family protein [Tautonia marina]